MNPAPSIEVTPICLLTGFLGSGKTTILNYLLRQPRTAHTAVVINEFGEIGLDHQLVESSTEKLVLLQSGCLCCTIRGDLMKTLRGMLEQRERGEIAFDRVIIETTGLADPAPILQTLITDHALLTSFRLESVIATVDAAAGLATLDSQFEAVKQAAVADRLLVTKVDLVEPACVYALERRLRALNPGAPIIRAYNGAVDPASILDAGLYDPSSKTPQVQDWLRAEAYPEHGHDHHDHHHAHDGHEHHDHVHDHGHDHDPNRHDDRISAVSYTVDEPIPALTFDVWLTALLSLRGPDLLRMKGLIHVKGMPGPFVLHGVQHVFHPPMLLKDWPPDDRRSKIVLIGRDLTPDFLQDSFGFLASGSVKERAGADKGASTL
ncbi:CobW family GTP-binding protein [Afifella pfennigii]|uniref:CobW family GTP-binding protein n=1 Tax=Afifella pfennigii TaxID=209897 RepID=UPI000A8CC06C|nr:GTP-binding protein [Afifella pfennigii]